MKKNGILEKAELSFQGEKITVVWGFEILEFRLCIYLLIVGLIAIDVVCRCDAVLLFPVSGFRSDRHVFQLQPIPAQHL